MANGAIPELQITGSTIWSTYHLASYGRLFFKLHSAAWVAQVNDGNQWIQIDLGGQHIKVTRIATQGRYACCDHWVTTYKLEYGNDKVHFHYYRTQGQAADKVKQI